MASSTQKTGRAKTSGSIVPRQLRSVLPTPSACASYCRVMNDYYDGRVSAFHAAVVGESRLLFPHITTHTAASVTHH